MLTDIDPPPIEPITLDETKAFLRVEHDADDALIETQITSARESLEAYLNIAMVQRTMQFSHSFSESDPRIVSLPRWPVASVGTVILDGTEITDFTVDLRKRPSEIRVPRASHIEVEFTAGYGVETSDVPAPLRQALLLIVARSYEQRSEVQGAMPLMVDALTMPYRVVGL